MVKAILLLAISIAGAPLRAGDAIAFDYETGLGGIFYSSCAAGGPDYMAAQDARAPALAMARQQGAKSPFVIHQSDQTGYFCLATGLNEMGRYVACVGYGGSDVKAKSEALKGLKAYGAVSEPNIICQYFSYGAESRPLKPTK